MNGDELKDKLRRSSIGHIEAAGKLGVNPAELMTWIQTGVTIPEEVAAKVKLLPDAKPRKPQTS